MRRPAAPVPSALRSCAALAAALAAALVGAAALTAVPPARAATAAPVRAEAAAATSRSAPATIPALTDWTPRAGRFRLGPGSTVRYARGDAGLRATATTLVADLTARYGHRVQVAAGTRAARPGDVVLAREPGERALGREGYRLDLTAVATITGARSAGAFLGTRTLLQLLGRDRTAPRGRTVDVPRYAERGVEVCACEVTISLPQLERLIREMAYLKLDYLLLPLKVKSRTHPETNKWSYYTRAQARRIAALAERYHVTVVPEINSPGHMEPYLYDRPDLQLTDREGNKAAGRIDITRPAAFRFYTDLVDEYAGIFRGPYWHMGADEYMLFSDYANYPQIEAYAKRRFGADAVPSDAFVDFVNRVDAHVRRTDGTRLRVWNDGLERRNIVPAEQGPHPRLNTDVTIEHWRPSYVEPGEFVAAGYRVMNAAQSLYENRGPRISPHDLCPADPALTGCVRTLWDGGWDPGTFEAAKGRIDPDSPALTGAHLSTWESDPSAETERQLQQALELPLRFLAQRTWSRAGAFESWDRFVARSRTVGHAPGWDAVDHRPLPDGTYTIGATGHGGALAPVRPTLGSAVRLGRGGGERWQLRHTDDGYYRIASSTTGYCLAQDVADGLALLTGQPGVGQRATTVPCAATDNHTKWEITGSPRTGYTLTHAIGQLAATVDRAGTLAQQPPDRAGGQRWRFRLRTPATLDLQAGAELFDPSADTTVTATFANTGTRPVTGLRVTADVPPGWHVTPRDRRPGAVVPRGATVRAAFRVRPPASASTSRSYRLTARATYASGGRRGTVTTATDARVDPITCPTPGAPVAPSDEFDGTTLDGCRWTDVHDPDPAALHVADGQLRIDTGEGDLAAGPPDGVRNLLLQPAAPGDDRTLEVKVTAPLHQQYQQAGVIVYGSDDDYVEFVLVAGNAPGTPPSLYYSLVSEADAQFGAGGAVNAFDPKGDGDDTWWLRLHQHGDTYSAEYSANGTDWTAMPGTVRHGPLDAPRIGLFATYPGTTVTFDRFHVS